MDANCGVTFAAGSWSGRTHGLASSADCWFVMSICSPHTAPSSTSPASGLRCGTVYETCSRYNLLSGVAAMLRTTPPPEGIVSVLKLSVLGSNLTRVFGFTPDSLYQTSPSLVLVIP